MRQFSFTSIFLKVLAAILLLLSSGTSLVQYACAHSGQSVLIDWNTMGNGTTDKRDMSCCRNMPSGVFEKLCKNASCSKHDHNDSESSSFPIESPWSSGEFNVEGICGGCSSADVSPDIAADHRGYDSASVLAPAIANLMTVAPARTSHSRSRLARSPRGSSPSLQVLFSSFLI